MISKQSEIDIIIKFAPQIHFDSSHIHYITGHRMMTIFGRDYLYEHFVDVGRSAGKESKWIVWPYL